MSLEFDPRSLDIVVTATIFGETSNRAARMLFDTGSSRTTLDLSVLNAVAAMPTLRTPYQLFTASGVTMARDFVLHGLNFGSLKFGPVTVQGTVISPDLEIDGMIGCDLMADRKTIIDFPNGKLQIVKSKKRTIKRK